MTTHYLDLPRNPSKVDAQRYFTNTVLIRIIRNLVIDRLFYYYIVILESS